MKKFLTVIAFVLSLLLFPEYIRATTDTAFTTTRLNKFGSVVIRTFEKFGFDISGVILPIFNKEGQIAAPDHEPTAKWKSAFNEYFTPQSYKDDGLHIDWDAAKNAIFYTSYYGAILQTDAEHSNHPEPTDCFISTTYEKSSDVPFAPLDFQKAREADAWLGINPVDPDEAGVVDFNLPSKVINGMNPGEDCKKHEPGFELPPIENDAQQLAQFGAGTQTEGYETTTITEIIRKWVIDHWVTEEKEVEEPHKDDVILTIKKRLPWYHILCHDGGCPGNEAGEYSGNAAISGGYAAFTLREEDKKPLIAASEQAYNILVGIFPQKPLLASYDIKNQSETRQKQAACYSVPDTENASYDNLQDFAAIGGKINLECSPLVQTCSSTPPTFTGSNSCSQCSPNMSGWAEPGTVPGNKLPDNLIKMVEQVGEAFGVPPASILTALYHEGAFVATPLPTDLYQSGPFVGGDNWTNENVLKWSTCGQGMPNCSVEENTYALCNVDNNPDGQCVKAIVGTGVIPKWFWGTGGDSDIWNAVQRIDPSRTQETISPCNLLDSVAAVGKALSIWGLYPRTPAQCFCKDGSDNYATCSKYSMTSATAGSCSASSWSDDKVAQSHTGLWTGSLPFCPDGSMTAPPEFGANSPNPGYAKFKVLDPYKAFSCK